MAAAAAGDQTRGEWSQTTNNVDYAVPETTVSGQVPNRQYEEFHMNNQYAVMQPASLTATYGFRGINLPSVFKGPSSVILMIAMTIFAAYTAVRKMLQRKAKSCDTCKSYGIVRCNLCGGQGSIAWEGKWSHTTLCPGCFGKRHVRCESCGGMHNRSRFGHVTSGSADVFPGSGAPVSAAAAAGAEGLPSIPSAERMRD